MPRGARAHFIIPFRDETVDFAAETRREERGVLVEYISDEQRSCRPKAAVAVEMGL
jgi:hypothetical protein